MWRSLKSAAQKSKVPVANRLKGRLYATSQPSSGSGTKKILITFIAVAGVGTGVAVAYGKYDPKFRKLIEENIPYSELLFKSLPDFQQLKEKPTEGTVVSEKKPKETTIEGSLLQKKQERLKKEVKPTTEPEINTLDTAKRQEVSKSEPETVIKQEIFDEKTAKTSTSDLEKLDDFTAIESSIKDLLLKLDKASKEVLTSQEIAVDAVKNYTNKLYQALEAPEGSPADVIWKQADAASSKKELSLKTATQKTSTLKAHVEKLKVELKKACESNTLSKSPLIYAGEEKIKKIEQEIKNAEDKIIAAQVEARTASEYKDLVKKAREQFKNELQIVLPKYINQNKDQPMTEDELNLLIAHAHRRIENLQKEIARQQVTEKNRIEEAVILQKIHDEKSIQSKISEEIMLHEKKLEKDFKNRLGTIRDEFEADMRQQLRRQAAAHADHLQEALQVQHSELNRKYSLEIEEKLLHQKGIFISEISESLSRLKGIEAHLKARSESDKSSRKAQALWLACQGMKDALNAKPSMKPSPLSKELALLKAAAGEENVFVSTVVAGIPSEAVHRGVYTVDCLKQRFEKVKRVCRRVAMIDENHRSLYRYFLSYLQSFLIIDVIHIPAEELQSKVAVDPSEWDTFDILSRVSFCLQRNDLEQALRYANQLKGEPRNVARDWISEVRLLLETTQAVDCLVTYASAIGIQAYH